LEARVIPRYMVLEILKSKRLLKREPSFIHTLNISEEKFLAKFIAKFRDHAEELLVAYKGHLLDYSSVDES
jgi:mTERF domain-containing protein